MKCSECGKEICVLSPTSYKYKVRGSDYYKDYKDNKDNPDKVSKYVCYQCGYTCYDHALLRVSKEKRSLSSKNYKNAVIQCEAAMKAQGKKILNPIKLKE